MRRFVLQIPYGGDSLEENVYLVFDQESRHGVMVDPGARCLELEKAIEASGISIKGILNTHGHFDHTGGNGTYRSKYRTEVYASAADRAFYEVRDDLPTQWIAQDVDLQLGSIRVRIIPTPGHSPGSICFLIGDCLFVGDTLFRGSIGRTPDDSSTTRLVNQIKEKLLSLPSATPVYAGHGETTAIDTERRSNPFLQEGQE